MFFFLWCFKNSNLKPSPSKEILQSFIIRKLKLHGLFNYTRSKPNVVLASSWLVFLARLFSLDVLPMISFDTVDTVHKKKMFRLKIQPKIKIV